MIQVVSLDLDDTLWDAGPVLRRAEEVQYEWIEMHAPRIAARYTVGELAHYRRELALTEPALRHDFTALRLAALRQLLADFGYDPAQARAGIDAFVRARSVVTLYPEVDAVLRGLRRNYRLVALTNGNTDLAQAGVAHYFEFALAPSDTGTAKPDPRMFEAVLARAGIVADAMVHVGDEPLFDIEGAHRACVPSVWVNRHGRAWPAEFRRAHREIANLSALPDALAALAGKV
jgi:putative hydrolase of the HAD superfamily